MSKDPLTRQFGAASIGSGRDIVGFFLILFGSFALFCAGIAAVTLVTLFVAEPGNAPIEWLIITTVTGFIGAVMVFAGRLLRGLSNATAELAAFAGNLLIAIGFAWMAFIGLCTAFLMNFASPPQGTPGGFLLSAILPFAIGVLIVIIGGALKYANTPK